MAKAKKAAGKAPRMSVSTTKEFSRDLKDLRRAWASTESYALRRAVAEAAGRVRRVVV